MCGRLSIRYGILFMMTLILNNSLLQAQESVLCRHFFGETIVPIHPKRVVALDIGALEQLDYLGIDIIAVPNEVPDHLAKYRADKYQKVGGVWEPNLQAVKAANPDLIFFGAWDAEMYKKFSEIAPTIGYAENIQDLMATYVPYFKLMGQIFGKQKEVEDFLIARYEEINMIRKFAESTDKKVLILLATQGRLHAFGSGSRFGFIHDELKLKAASDSLGTDIRGTIVDDAFIQQANPDIIFMIDRDLALKGESAGAEKIITNGIKNTNAFKNGSVFWLEPRTWYLSGQGTSILQQKINDIKSAISKL